MKNAYLNDYQIHDYQNAVDIWLKPKIDGLDIPTIRLPSFERPNIDGSFVPNQLYGGRAITIEGKVIASDGDVVTYRENRRAFEAVARIYRPGGVLSPVLFKFTTMDDLALQVEVYVRKLKFADQNIKFGDFQLDLYAPDIRLLSQEEYSQQFNIFSGGGMEVPMAIPMSMGTSGSIETEITNAGDTETFPTFTLYGTIEDPTISNQTTGDSFALDYTLTDAAQFIVVDIENRTVLYYATQSTAPVNIRDKFSGDWFKLASGVNSLKLVVANTTHTGFGIVRWRDAFLGI